MADHVRPRSRTLLRRSRRPGVTLIELLVAISILAIVAVLGWRGLDGIVRARVALTANLDQTRAMQLTFAQMQSDCAQVIPATLITQHLPVVADPSRLMMVRYVHGEDQPTRLQVVTYRVRDGLLTRRESTATRDLGELDVAWQAAASDVNVADALVLQSDVTAITMRLWQEGASWRSPPPPGEVTSTGTPFTGLEVALQLRGRSTSMLKVFLLGAA